MLTLRVRAHDLTAAHDLTLAVNGNAVSATRMAPAPADAPVSVWLYCAAHSTTFHMGENLVTAVVKDNATGPPRIDQVRLDVRYQE